jgi:hypothetical protein
MYWVADPQCAAMKNAAVESGTIHHGIEHGFFSDRFDVPARRRQASRLHERLPEPEGAAYPVG